MADETIYKYELTDETVQYVDVPAEHRVLSIDVQHVPGDIKKVCMWVLVNAESQRQRRLQVHCLGTGLHVPPEVGFDYYNTVVFDHDDVRHHFVKAL